MSETTSTKPYLLRALYEWCSDNGYTPYIVVKVFGDVHVPMEFVRDGEIVLNIAFTATSGLKMDNEAITFKARFAGIPRDIYIPIEAVSAIYASENNQGMSFDVMESAVVKKEIPPSPVIEKTKMSLAVTNTEMNLPPEDTNTKKIRKKPSFTVIK